MGQTVAQTHINITQGCESPPGLVKAVTSSILNSHDTQLSRDQVTPWVNQYSGPKVYLWFVVCLPILFIYSLSGDASTEQQACLTFRKHSCWAAGAAAHLTPRPSPVRANQHLVLTAAQSSAQGEGEDKNIRGSAPKGPLEWHQEASRAHLGGSPEAKVKTGHHDFPETGCPCFSVASLHGNHRKINHGLRDRENFLWLILGQGCTFSRGRVGTLQLSGSMS